MARYVWLCMYGYECMAIHAWLCMYGFICMAMYVSSMDASKGFNLGGYQLLVASISLSPPPPPHTIFVDQSSTIDLHVRIAFRASTKFFSGFSLLRHSASSLLRRG